ncbi:MAG: periplasmic heavy metal sensor [Verrucomicrobiota bacterium]
MKTTPLNQILSPTTLLTIATAVVLQASTRAQAQPEPDRPNPPASEARRAQPGGPAGFRGGQGQGFQVMEQVLTEDQRESLRPAMEAQREKMRGLQEKIRDARKAMMTAALADEFKDDVVKAKAMEVAKLEAEVTVMRLKALSEVQPALSKEQMDKLLNPPQPRGLGPNDGGNRPANQRGNRPPRNRDGEPNQPNRPPQ